MREEGTIYFETCPKCLIGERRWLSGVKRYTDFCLLCSNKVQNEKNKEKYKKTGYKNLTCLKCQEIFREDLGRGAHSKYCPSCKLKKGTEEANKRWLEKEEKPQKRQNNEAVAYSFFRKKYSIPNNVFRG